MARASTETAFVQRVREAEERLFPDFLHADDATRMKGGPYSWLYRPSHHAGTGLVTEADVSAFAESGKRMLSVGAHPAYLERVLVELGVPAANVVVADADPAVGEDVVGMDVARFDMLGPWPDIGTFDLILFPESLCIALSDRIKAEGPQGEGPFASDALESRLLADALRQALPRLKPGGEIRANGPQSHPNVVKAARSILDDAGLAHAVDYERYFLRVRRD